MHVGASISAPSLSTAAVAAATDAPPAPCPSPSTGRSTGRFGKFGGKYVPETLIPALAELEVSYKEAMEDPAFHVSLGLVGVLIIACSSTCSLACEPPHAAGRRPACALSPPPQAELNAILKDYVGRETPLYYAERLSQHYRRPDGSMAEIYLKREDLNHTGAHKINNALGQALLCKRMGKTRVIAETGAGQHGVATVRGWEARWLSSRGWDRGP